MEHIVNKNSFVIVVLGDFNKRMQGWFQVAILEQITEITVLF